MEEWKEHKNFPRYLVSNFGEVKAKRSGRLKIKSTNQGGYFFVNLYQEDMGKPKPVPVHRLVAEIFIPGSGETVNHKNGIKKDNSVENLEWASRAENASHAWKIGLTPVLSGEECGKSKLSNAVVREIRMRHKSGETQTSLSKEFKITQANVSCIVLNKTWKHI